MFHNNVEVAVLIKGRPITEYAHRGQIFIEGRAGSEYEIEIRNKNNFRIEAVLSVDGLSVTDGKAAGAQSSGYLVEANRTVRVPGWTLDNASTAKFAFTGKEVSYATDAAGGEARNNGVIGVMVFSEKYVPPQYVQQPLRSYTGFSGGSASPFDIHTYYSGNSGSGNTFHSKASKRFGAKLDHEVKTSGGSMRGGPISPGMSYNASSGWNSSGHDGVTCSASAGPQAYNMNVGGLLSPSVSNHVVDQSSFNAPLTNVEIQSLGTAFGARTDFATIKVDFHRGDMLAMMMLYYDEARGLKARGIQMVRPSKQKYQTSPDAFPAMVEGCRPPRNWRG